MSYQVLARKWRPKSFGTLVGQEHVVRALSHALATGRLHHAWLFTGTRGVGKTTISRILAKALNCETGVTAEPCGTCSACVAIDADRFPDYVEMDAASNRGVDDMAALLDQAVYAPVQGRYKVYMIDEVHMLTGHAFNAMLKTLEEPPAHVKFILATTDPQKIPVTVLSRCLQFNLKQMPPGHIVEHLGRILAAEQIQFEPLALRHIARAAGGSMRDALSLLDQTIAHGAGRVEEAQVTQMLGTVGDDHLYALLDAVRDGDVAALLAVADGMEARSLSFDAALQALASLVHRIALMQFAPAAIADEAERGRLTAYAAGFDAEFLQLAYQILIHGRDELPLAPDEYAGFTMSLLRLVAFRPEAGVPLGGASGGGGGEGRARMVPPLATPVTMAAPAPRAESRHQEGAGQQAPATVAPEALTDLAQDAGIREGVLPVAAAAVQANSPVSVDDVPPWMDLPPEALEEQHATQAFVLPDGPPEQSNEPSPERVPASQSVARAVEASGDAVVRDAPDPEPEAAQATDEVASGGLPAHHATDSACDADFTAALVAGDWHACQRMLGLGGMLRELAQHCEYLSGGQSQLALRLSSTHRHLLSMNPALADKLGDAVNALAGRKLRVRIEVGEIAGETPAQRDAAERAQRHAAAVASLERDPFVRELIERFDATLVEASVKPL